MVSQTNNGPPTPPTEPAVESGEEVTMSLHAGGETAEEQADEFDSFSEPDEQALLDRGDSIVNLDPSQMQEAWRAWAKDHKVRRRTSWNRTSI